MTPPSAEKPLLGEPTARTLIQRLLAIAPLGELAIVEEARAYLATRAPAEEALAIENARLSGELQEQRADNKRQEESLRGMRALQAENTRLVGWNRALQGLLNDGVTLRHMATATPFRPLCGSDVPGQATTDHGRAVTCPMCHAATSDKQAIRQPAALPVEGRAPANCGDGMCGGCPKCMKRTEMHWAEGRAPDKPKFSNCTCYRDCGADSHSGDWHQHGDDPCPEHPDVPMVDGPPPSFKKQIAAGRAPDASHEGPSSTWTLPDGEQVELAEWPCPDCKHNHLTALGGICIGCPCERSEPPDASHEKKLGKKGGGS